MRPRCLKSAEINDSKEIAFESFQTDFQPKRPIRPQCLIRPLKKNSE
ncbi:MAG: hypothetical protein LBB88_06355 [Planctomycetaceae bacterium]|nr:hypothetical protein [Planctomycetaceae bacterium]